MSDVPQVSILGTLLHNIYTSQFVKTLKFYDYQMYADDTQRYCFFRHSVVEIINNHINIDLKSTPSWN